MLQNNLITKVIVFVLIVVFTSSCASIINGGSQDVLIQSKPEDAKITILNKKGEPIGGGVTPATLTLERGAGFFSPAKYTVRFEKAGYDTREVQVDGKMNGWYIGGNILFGGFIGWLIIDPATGGMWTLTPEEIRAELAPLHGAIWNEKSGFLVILKEHVPVEFLEYMKPIELN